jgi:transcription initiation factor IIF auxiliary subunit
MLRTGTEIRSYYSIREIAEGVEEEIEVYRSAADEYSQWLGSFLRDAESTIESKENLKWLKGLQKGKTKKTKKDKKSKKAQESDLWIQLGDLSLTSAMQGEAEVLFDAVEEINKKIEKLENARDSIKKLEESGLGSNVVYVTLICDGVPMKIVVRPKREGELDNKFHYEADFSILEEIQ